MEFQILRIFSSLMTIGDIDGDGDGDLDIVKVDRSLGIRVWRNNY